MKKLTQKQRDLIIDMYGSDRPRKEVQEELSLQFGVKPRQIRKYAKDLDLNTMNKRNCKVLVYDIETSRVRADVWGTGKMYINYKQLKSHTRIISIAWKYVGEDEVYSLTWDKNHCDKRMLIKFLKEYNKASMVIGQNNNSFDNKLINTRAAYHRLFVDRFVKSFDIYRKAKTAFRLHSYSMAFMADYFGLTLKQSHEGIYMWEMIEYGNKQQKKEYLKKMVNYNKGDIVTTEELYMTLKPYFSSVTNRAIQEGNPKWFCPVSGNNDVKLLKTIFTESGTVQRILYCRSSNHQFKVSNRTYQSFLERRINDL